MPEPLEPTTNRRALIVTSLPSEYKAVRAHLRDSRERVNSTGTILEQGHFDGKTGPWDVAVAQIGTAGIAAATIAVESAIQSFQPAVLFVVGVAVGLKGRRVARGDVIIATKIYAQVESLPLIGEFLPRLETRSPSHRLQQRALQEATRTNWLARRKGTLDNRRIPKVHVGPIGSSEHLVRGLDFVDRSVLAIDIESHTVMSAVDRSGNADVLVIRGISDLENPTKSDKWLDVAAQNASAFAFEVLAHLDVDTAGPSLPPEPKEDLAHRYLTSLSVDGVRSITELDWNAKDGPGWHVIIGDNGGGKTTLLRSIALGLLSTRETDALRLDWDKWLPPKRETGRIELALTSPGSPAPLERWIELNRSSSDPGTILPGGKGREQPADIFCVGYGPFRRFSGGDLEYEKDMVSWPRLLRQLTLFSESAALAESLAWLRELRFKQLELLPEGQQLLPKIKAFINSSDLLPQGTQLQDVSSDAVTFDDGNGVTVGIHELSDGFRSILSLVLDVIRHLANAFGPTRVFSSTDLTRVIGSGIILIDELDVHLHPTWQHSIGSWFRQHFPNMQFIIATHSPLLCQAADTVFMLPRPGSEDIGRMLEGIELDRLRYGNVLDAYGTGVFGSGVDRSEESKALLEQLATLNQKELEQELTPDEQGKQEHLRAILPTARPTLDSDKKEPRG